MGLPDFTTQSASQYKTNIDESINNTLKPVTTGGTGDAYTATLGITAYETGRVYTVKLDRTSSTATPTLDLDGLGPIGIRRIGGQILEPQELIKDTVAHFLYDGSNMLFLSPLMGQGGVVAGGSVSLGVSAQNWGNQFTFIEAGTLKIVGTVLNNTEGYLAANAYHDGSVWRRISTDSSSLLQLINGTVSFHVNPTGPGGLSITWTKALEVQNDGSVLVAAPPLKLQGSGPSTQFLNSGGVRRYQTKFDTTGNYFVQSFYDTDGVTQRSALRQNDYFFTFTGFPSNINTGVIRIQPSDYSAGKPSLEIRKSSIVDRWEISLYDALTTNVGTLAFYAGGYEFNNSGVEIGSPTGGNKGAGTLNAQDLYIQGQLIPKGSDRAGALIVNLTSSQMLSTDGTFYPVPFDSVSYTSNPTLYFAVAPGKVVTGQPGMYSIYVSVTFYGFAGAMYTLRIRVFDNNGTEDPGLAVKSRQGVNGDGFVHLSLGNIALMDLNHYFLVEISQSGGSTASDLSVGIAGSDISAVVTFLHPGR